MYSLIESAKQNGMDPYLYLREIFEAAPYMKSSDDWEALLPWNISAQNAAFTPVGKN